MADRRSPTGRNGKIGILFGEGKDAKRAAEMIGESMMEKIPYGESRLSKAVQLRRLIDKKKNGNHASALLDDGTALVARADRTLHSEEHLLDRAGTGRALPFIRSGSRVAPGINA